MNSPIITTSASAVSERHFKAKKRPVTLTQIASKAECSLAQVSKVLNNSKGNMGVSPQLREKILAVASELDYKPHFAARSLVSHRVNTLGIFIVPGPWFSWGNPYEGRLINGMQQAAEKLGQDILLVGGGNGRVHDACIRKLEERRIDGVVLVHATSGEPWLEELIKYTPNLVAVDCLEDRTDIDTVVFDNSLAVKLAVDHLVKLGHRAIGFLGSCIKEPSSHSILREKAFYRCMAEAGLSVNPQWVHNGSKLAQPIDVADEYCQLEGKVGIRNLCSPGKDRPTAVVAYNDLVASGAYDGLNELNLEPGKDISMIGIDDYILCRYLRPRLSSIKHPLEEMGQTAIEYLVNRVSASLSNQSDDDTILSACRSHVCNSELVARGSTHALLP